MNSPHNADLAEAVFPATPQALFDAESLRHPPVPAGMAALLQPAGPVVFTTRPLQESPYDLDHYLLEFEADPALPDYAVVGFDGHGINSWAAHYYVVCDGLALFIQLPWGGAYLKPEPARAEIADLFDWAALLQSKMALAQQRQLIPGHRRLQVVASRFTHAGWRWLEVGTDNTSVPWNEAAGMKAAIQQALDHILAN
jgi:hypothetical protein